MSRLLVAPTAPRRRSTGVGAAVGTVVVALCGVLALGALMLGAGPAAAVATRTCDPVLRTASISAARADQDVPVRSDRVPGDLDAAQTRNARLIVDVGRRLGVSARGWLVALATALQESSLRNLDHGDRDSRGLFQQRPSQGWGSAAQVSDPEYAARAFYDRLLAVPGWERLPVTVAAQRVQRSAFPEAYTKWVGRAAGLVRTLDGVGDLSGCTSGPPAGAGGLDGAARSVLAFAYGQVGKPYRWGATGPGAFDCSGLAMRAYAAAGITVPRTSRAQFGVGEKVPLADAQPGDLAFWGADPTNPATISHVAIVVSPGRVLEAPTEGVPVRVREWDGGEPGLFPVVVRPGAST